MADTKGRSFHIIDIGKHNKYNYAAPAAVSRALRCAVSLDTDAFGYLRAEFCTFPCARPKIFL